MAEVPSVKVIENIRPVNAGTGEEALVYEGLSAAVEQYKQTNTERSQRVWDSEPDSLEELSKARQLAFEYLLRTSDKVIDSSNGNRDIWAARFTLAASELYGLPDTTEATKLITNEYQLLCALHGKNDVPSQPLQLLLDTYKPMVRDQAAAQEATNTSEEAQEKQALDLYGEAMRQAYQPLFDIVDATPKNEFTPDDMYEVFTESLNWLKNNDDSAWGEWSVALKEGTAVSVNASDRLIKVARQRGNASAQDVKGLIAHELLVHGLRAKNGYKLGDKKLATGLPGYLDSEEGLGILAETAINGTLPDKAYDRYVDIALALGTIDGKPKNRHELYKISYARQLIRAAVHGESVNPDALSVKTWTHVDRIYRGGPGDAKGQNQAVFTKDVAYYAGYKQMARYIAKELHKGVSATEVFMYISQAKFDPTNLKHVEHLVEAQNLLTKN